MMKFANYPLLSMEYTRVYMIRLSKESFGDDQLVGLRERLQENPMIFLGKSMVSA